MNQSVNNRILNRRWHIYFAQAGGNGLIKIGRSRNVAKRLAGMPLPDGSTTPLRLLAQIPVAPRHYDRTWDTQSPWTTERDLHKRFADSRVVGEWFRPTPDVVAFIALLNREVAA